MPLSVLCSSFSLSSVFQVSSTEKEIPQVVTWQPGLPVPRMQRKRSGVGGCESSPHWVPKLTYTWSFLSRPFEALAMSRLGPEAGYIIVALTSVPLAAFLLTTKPKLLVFIASFGIGTGGKVVFTGYPEPCKS